MLGDMERPAYLRKDLYDEILTAVAAMSATDVRKIAQKCNYKLESDGTSALLVAILACPSPYLACRGILEDSAKLTGLYIEFDDGELDEGHTYFIDAEAAIEIASKDHTILLRSRKEGALIPRARLERAFRDGASIDYSERQSA